MPVFPSRANLKLHNVSVSPKMVKKVITNLDLSKHNKPLFIEGQASGPHCIPVVDFKEL